MGKPVSVLIAAAFVCFTGVYCGAQEETITISTHYPSPRGKFNTFRLWPTNEPADGQPGLMYYNMTTHKIVYHNDTGWVNLTSDNDRWWSEDTDGNIVNTNNGNVTIRGNGIVGQQDLLRLEDNGEAQLCIRSASDNAVWNPQVYAQRSRGTIGVKQPVFADDVLLEINGTGYDGSDYKSGAKILLKALDNPSSGKLKGKAEFWTTGAGTEPELRMKVDETGVTLYNGGGYFLASDAALKTSVRPLQGSLENLSMLRGVSFLWKGARKQDVGLVAQEVEKVYPELVLTDPGTGIKSIAYSKLIPVLVEAVKEQESEIRELRRELESLKGKAAD